MYIPEKIKALSNTQISKMLNGLPIRVQKGLDHVINMSMEQSKKLNKSAMSGKGFTIRLDPYQIVQHRHLAGQGFSSMLKGATSMAKTAAKKAGKQLAQKGLSMAHSYAQDAINEHLSGEGFGDYLKVASKVAKTAAKKAGKQLAQKGLSMAHSYAQDAINQHLSGEGFGDYLRTAGKFAQSTAKSAGKQIAKKSLNLAHKAISDALPEAAMALGSVVGHPELGEMVSPLAQMGIDKGFSVAKAKSGLGIRKRGPGRPKSTKPKTTKPKTKKRRGGALRPAGY
jgi:hypothetical protein